MWAIIAAVIAVAASAGVYYQQRKMEAQAKKQAQEAKAVQISGHDSNRGLYTVYGKALIGSTTVWKKVSDKQTRMTQTGFTTFSRGTGDLINGTRDLKSNRFLYRAVSLCAGPIQSVENILIDDEGYQSSRFGQGDDRHFAAAVSLGPTAGQNFSAMRTSYSDFNAWGTSFTGKGVAYAIERLYLDNDKPAYQGEPSTKYLVKGRKLYDPRKDSTSSVYDATLGTSSHRFATPTTWEWSDNPVLALLDYMTNSEYGRGLALSVIDLPSIAEAADKCDELVDIPARLTNTTGSSYDFYDPETGQVITVPVNTNIPNYRPEQGSSSQQKRFRINIAIDPSKELLDNIQEILNVFRGNLSYANGKYRVHMADVASPVLTIGDDDIITGLKISNGDRSQRMNRATVKFINANKQHKTDQASWPSLDSNEDDGLYDTYLTEDQGERLHKTFTIKGCTDFYQAQDTAEFLVRDSRSNLTVAGTFGSRCFGLVPGDVVSLTYDSAGYSGKYFRVMQVAIDLNSMNVNLQLKEYDSSVYTWNDARGNEPEGITWQEEVVNASPTTPVIGTLSSTTRTRADGSTALTLTVPFSNIPEQAQYVDVEWGINGTDQYNSQVVFDTENINQVEVPIERDNQTYAVRVRYFIADSAGTLMASTFATDTIAVGNLTGTKLGGIEEGATANNIYQQDDEPTGGTYNDGDIWIDTNDGYRMYLRSGGAWVDRADTRIATAITDAAGAQATADGKVVTFFQDAEPAAASSSTGDLWIDTNDSNKLYRYNGTDWESVRDAGIASAISSAATAQSTADGKIVTFYQDDEPADASSSTGDLWFDTNDNNKLYRYNGTDWVSARDAGIATALSNAATAQSTADGKIVTFYQDGEPAVASSSEGDLWIDTNDNNKLYRFNGTAWQAARDSGIATAISDAATAQATADGKVTTFYAASSATPTPEGTGDLWYQTDTQLFFRYNGSGWQEVASYNTGDLADLDTVGTTQIDDDAVTIDKIANTLQSTNYSAGSAGWKLTTDGTFEAGNGTFRGALTATSLTLDGTSITESQLESGVQDSLGLADTATQNDTAFAAKIAWGFDSDAQGWVASYGTITHNSDGYVLFEATTNDPMFIKTGLSIDGGKDHIVRVRIKRVAGSSWQGTLYYGTSGHGDSESYRKTISDTTVTNEWVVLEYDMSNLTAGGTDWVDNTITRLRFDWGNSSSDDFQIDWIAIGTKGAAPVREGGEIISGTIGGVTITDSKLYQGSGTFNNTNTGFYLDSDGKFSLKDKLRFNPTENALTVKGSIEADVITVNESLQVIGDLKASSLAIGSITREMFTQDALDEIYGALATAVGGSNGDFKQGSGSFTTSGGTVSLGLFDHGESSVEVEFLQNYSFNQFVDYTGTALQATLNFEVSADNTFTDLTSATQTHTFTLSKYDLSSYYGSTYIWYYGPRVVTKTFTTSALPDNTDLYFRVRVSGVGSAFTGKTFPFSVEANEGVTGVVSTGGNADTLDNLDSTAFLRSNVDDTFDGTLTLTGNLRGPASFTIDPSGHGDNTGTVIIAGNLQVDGTTTTINSTTVEVDDKNIVLASGAANAAAADGAGITIDGPTGATFTYNATNDTFVSGKWMETPNLRFGAGVYGAAINSKASYLLIQRDEAVPIELWGSAIESRKAHYFGGSSATAPASIDTSGNLSTTGTLTASGYNNSNWDTAYTYSQVGHLPLAGGTMTGNVAFNTTDRGITWSMNTDGAYIKFFNTGDSDTNSRLEYATSDNGNEYHRFVIAGNEKMAIKGGGTTIAGTLGVGTSGDVDGNLHVQADTTSAAYVSAKKTYGTGTGTSERAKLVLSINENDTTLSAADRPFFSLETRTSNESSSSNSITELKVRSSGSLVNSLVFFDSFTSTYLPFTFQAGSYLSLGSQTFYSGRNTWQSLNAASNGYDTVFDNNSGSPFFNALGGYKINSTVVIDGSRNLHNLGYISIGDTTTATIDDQTDYSSPLVLRRTSNSGKGAIVMKGSDNIGTAIEFGRSNSASHWGTYLDFLVHNDNTSDATTHLSRKLRIDANGLTSYGIIQASGQITANSQFVANSYIDVHGIIYSRSNLQVLNAAGTGWNTWATRSSGAYNLNVGTISSGAITSTGSTHYLGGIKIKAQANGENYIAFRGTTGDQPGNYNHAYIGEHIYGGTEQSELLLAKFNDVEGGSGSDRIRLQANNIVFDVWSSVITPGNQADLSSAAGTGTVTTAMKIRQNGDIEVGGSKFVDSSRNLSNVGTISGFTSTAHTVIRSGNTNAALSFGTGDDFAAIGFNRNVTNGAIYDSGTNAFQLQLQDGVFELESYNGAGVNQKAQAWAVDTAGNMTAAGVSNAVSGYQVNGNTVIDSNRRNIYLDSFAGGNNNGIFFRSGFTSSSNGYNCSITVQDHNGASADGLHISGYDGVGIGAGANTYSVDLLVNTSGDTQLYGQLLMGSTVVLDTGRNLKNVTVTSAEAESGHSLNGNFGQFQAHGTYNDFNTDVAYWGWNYVQGTGNRPAAISNQWYRNRVSLGSGYGFGSAGGDYWLEMAYPRYGNGAGGNLDSQLTRGSMWVRTCEAGSEGSWSEIGANLYSGLEIRGTTVINSSRGIFGTSGQFGSTGVGGSSTLKVYHTANFEAATFQTNQGGSLLRFIDPTAQIEIGIQAGKPVIRTGNTARLTVDGANVQINSGALQMANTTVIDTSRNVFAARLKATTAVHPGSVGYWKLRDNGGGSQLVAEYSTSDTLSDANIKWRVLNDGTTQQEGSLRIGSTTVIDTSRLIQNASMLTDGYIRIATGSIAASNTTNGLFMDGNYTNGQYRHRWRKQDNGGGVPLYLDRSHGTANSYQTIARFGPYSGNAEEFEVYGAAKISGALTTTGNITHLGSEGREVQSYMPSSYTTYDIVSGHEYGWYNDYWRIGMSRSGGTPGEKFRFNFNGSYKASILTTGYFEGAGATVSGQYQISGTNMLDSSGARNLRSDSSSYTNAFNTWNTYNDTTNNPANSWWYGMRISHGDAMSYYSATIGINFFSDEVQLRRMQGGTSQGWRKFALQGLLAEFSEVRSTGNVTAYYSDERLKDFHGRIDSPLEKIKALGGYYFTENEKAKELGYDNDQRQVGVNAQEVQAVLPEVVDIAPISHQEGVDEEYLTVHYDKMVPLLIEAIKEQQEQIEQLQAMLKEITNGDH